MGDIIHVKAPSDVNLVLYLYTLNYIFDEEREVLVVKKRPLISQQWSAGARHWFRFVGPYVRGGFKVYPAGDGVWERTLPYGYLRVEKAEDGQYKIEARGAHVFVPASDYEFKPAKTSEMPPVEEWWALMLYDNSLNSRTCMAGVSVITIRGAAHTTCADTATRIWSRAACIAYIKNYTIYKVIRYTGEYRGSCWTEEEVKKLVIKAANGRIRIEEIPATDELDAMETKDDEIV